MALGSWFSSLWNKAGPTIAAVAAVAAGQPELAIPASQAAAATIKKPSPPPPVVAPPVALPAPASGGFLAAYQSLTPADKEVVVIGGGVLALVALIRFVAPSGRR